jgi:predicted PurR-regulated permease PerM
MLSELKSHKFSIIILACLIVITVTTLSISIESEQLFTYQKHNFNQSQTNFDGILQTLSLTKENNENHHIELLNQHIIINQTNMENNLLKSINYSLNKILGSTDTQKHINTTLKH